MDGAEVEALTAWGLEGERLARAPSGLINRTWFVGDPPRFVLQALNPIFAPSVNEDIDRVTRHLERAGIATPRLVRTLEGEAYAARERVYRLLSYVAGQTFDRARSPVDAEAAGGALARFHRAMSSFDAPFTARRLGVHDTDKHLAALAEAEAEGHAHPLYGEVARLAERLRSRLAALPALPIRPERVVHGDPKISNVLFDEAGRAICLVDLDTVGPMRVLFELGDAFRSWCNTSTSGENDADPEFSLALFEAGVRGYLRGDPEGLDAEERAALPTATMWIALELSARFAADALRERYFGWDPARFATRGEHNLLRARGQLALAESLWAQRGEAERGVTRAEERAKESSA